MRYVKFSLFLWTSILHALSSKEGLGRLSGTFAEDLDDTGLSLRLLTPLDISPWSFKGGFCTYAISTQISRAGTYNYAQITLKQGLYIKVFIDLDEMLVSTWADLI